jgi:hypothetical protein
MEKEKKEKKEVSRLAFTRGISFVLWDLLSFLSWIDIVNFYEAFQEELEDVFYDSAKYSSFLAKREKLFRDTPLKIQRMSFKDYLEYWHLNEHSRYFARNLLGVFERPVSYYRSLPVFPPQPARYFFCCRFMPEDSPRPFQNALIAAEQDFAVRIYLRREESYFFASQFTLAHLVYSIAVSPSGTKILLLGNNKKITIVGVKEEGLDFVETDLVSRGTNLKRGCFADEKTFFLMDDLWNIWRCQLDGQDLRKEIVHAPNVDGPTRVTEDNQAFVCLKLGPDMNFLYWKKADVLVHPLFCGRTHKQKFHALKFVSLTTGREDKLYFANSLIVDYIASWDFSRVFVACVGSLTKMQFESVHPSFEENNQCPQHAASSSLSSSVYIYEITWEEETIVIESRFYVPSLKQMWENETAELAGYTMAAFARQFNQLESSFLSFSATKNFIFMTYKKCHIFLFPLMAENNTLPFSEGLQRNFGLAAITEDAEVLALLPRYTHDTIFPLRLIGKCPVGKKCLKRKIYDTEFEKILVSGRHKKIS